MDGTVEIRPSIGRLTSATDVAKRRPTMTEVSRAAGVSLKTVSRVVRGEPNVTVATATRVRRAIKDLGFRRNSIASALREGQTSRTIGLIIEDVGNPFSASLYRAVEATARTKGYLAFAASANDDPATERLLINSLLEHRVAGILLVSASSDHRYLRKELDLGLPIVFVDYPPVRLRADAVLIDNRGGAKTAVDHLLAQGHREIALLGSGLEVYSMRGRYEGFVEAMNGAGIPIDSRLVALDCHDVESAQAQMARLLELDSPPTAVFASNNRITIGVLRALARSASRPALIGFDDFELADMLATPVTVVAYGPDELGRVATELLFRRIHGDPKPVQTLVVGTELITRGSAEISVWQGMKAGSL